MTPIIHAAPVPKNREISTYLREASFANCYTFQIPHASTTAFEIYKSAMSQPPVWFDTLMTIRNHIVSIFGIKSLDGVPPQTAGGLRPGDRIGIFSLLHLSDDEILVEDRDRHLDVRLSVCKLPGGTHAAVSTVVHIYNWFGRAYMLVVGPIHRLIVPIMLRHSLGKTARNRR